MTSTRVFVVVLDGVGIGALPDADEYGDKNTNTVSNIAQKMGGLHLPNLQKMGLGNLAKIKGVPPETDTTSAFGKAVEISAGKDSTTGHWELMGLQTKTPFPTYPNGFPDVIIEKFKKLTNSKAILGNKAESGTVIINELGEKHLETKFPIIYTSGDSVFQIAAHEDIVPVKKLYKMCRIAREEILVGKHSVGRVIARPFIGTENGNFERTPRRKDFSLSPPKNTLLDYLFESGITVTGIGKIEDLFNNRGITFSNHTQHNPAALDALEETIASKRQGFVFVNLPDFDTAWGHRNNYKSFAHGLEQFDIRISKILSLLNENDIIFITADHGCDPTTSGTDHTREYIPILIYGHRIKNNIDIGIRKSFSDLGATISELFKLKSNIQGTSFLQKISLDNS